MQKVFNRQKNKNIKVHNKTKQLKLKVKDFQMRCCKLSSKNFKKKKRGFIKSENTLRS